MARLRYNDIGDAEGTVSPITFTDGSTTTGTWSTDPGIPTISANDYIAIIVQALSGSQEIVYLSDYTTASLSGSFLRGQEGTTGVAHASTAWIHGPTTVDFVPTILLTHTGEPVTDDGTFIAGQKAVDTDGIEFLCTDGGVPGTWVQQTIVPGYGLTAMPTPAVDLFGGSASMGLNSSTIVGATTTTINNITLEVGTHAVDFDLSIEATSSGPLQGNLLLANGTAAASFEAQLDSEYLAQFLIPTSGLAHIHASETIVVADAGTILVKIYCTSSYGGLVEIANARAIRFV